MNADEMEELQGFVTRTCVLYPKGPAHYLVDTVGLPYEVMDPEEADSFVEDWDDEEEDAVALFDGIAPIPANDVDVRDLLVGVLYKDALPYVRSSLTWDRLPAILALARRAVADEDTRYEVRKELGMGDADMQLLRDELGSVRVPETKRKAQA